MAGPWHSSGDAEQIDFDKLDIKELLVIVIVKLDTIINHLYSITDEEGV